MSLWNIVSFWLLTLLVIITCMSVCICRSGFLSLDDAVMLKEWIQGSSWCFVDGLSFACLLWLLHSYMCLVWQSHALKLSKCEDLKQDVLRETLQLWALFYSFFFFFLALIEYQTLNVRRRSCTLLLSVPHFRSNVFINLLFKASC